MIAITPFKDIESKKFSDSYLKEFKNLLDSGDFYFSYSWDLTNSFQRLEYEPSLDNDFIGNYLDSRFWWNEYLLTEIAEFKINEWVLPLIRGFIQVSPMTVMNKSILFILISRRSKYMSGTRYHTRGCDFRGNTSNFVETEQIVQVDNTLYSFVQLST